MERPRLGYTVASWAGKKNKQGRVVIVMAGMVWKCLDGLVTPG